MRRGPRYGVYLGLDEFDCSCHPSPHTLHSRDVSPVVCCETQVMPTLTLEICVREHKSTKAQIPFAIGSGPHCGATWVGISMRRVYVCGVVSSRSIEVHSRHGHWCLIDEARNNCTQNNNFQAQMKCNLQREAQGVTGVIMIL